MAEISFLCSVPRLILIFFTLFSCLFGHCYSLENLGGYETFTTSSFKYPETQIRPFDMRYIRVDLPPWFSSMSIALKSSVDLDVKSIEKIPKSVLPMICFRDGSLPLPDVSNTSLKALFALSNGSFEGMQVFQNTEQCYPVSRNMIMKLTNICQGFVFWSFQWCWAYKNTVEDDCLGPILLLCCQYLRGRMYNLNNAGTVLQPNC